MKVTQLHASIDYFEQAQLLDALYSIDPWSVDRNGWIALIAAAKHGGLNEDDVERWADCKTHREFDSTWRSLHERDGGATAGTIYHHAKQAGWSAAPDEPIGWDDEISVEVAPWLSECVAQRTAQPAPPAPDWRDYVDDLPGMCEAVVKQSPELAPFFEGLDVSQESTDKAITALTHFTEGQASDNVAAIIRGTAAYKALKMDENVLERLIISATAVYKDTGRSDEEAQRRFKYTPPTPPATARMEFEMMEQPQPKQERKTSFTLFSATELLSMDIPPVRFLVDDFIPQGLTLLCAAPKVGKSWLCLDLAISLSSGAEFLGHKCNRCGVLYLCLEDSLGRMQGRIRKLLQGAEPPEGFVCTTTAGTLDTGLVSDLESYILNNSDTGLVIIDTLAKVRGGKQRSESDYQYDSREMGELKKFADSHGIGVIVVHHMRKMKDADDPFFEISGTNGLMGISDTTFVIKKPRNTEQGILYQTGRDVDGGEWYISFDRSSARWSVCEGIHGAAVDPVYFEYERSPIVNTVRALLENVPEWRGRAGELKAASQDLPADWHINATSQAINKEISRFIRFFAGESITVEKRTNGKGSGEWLFKKSGGATNPRRGKQKS